MADNKNQNYQNPFSLLGEDNPQVDDRVNGNIHSELSGLLNDLGLKLEGNKITVKDKPDQKKS